MAATELALQRESVGYGPSSGTGAEILRDDRLRIGSGAAASWFFTPSSQRRLHECLQPASGTIVDVPIACFNLQAIEEGDLAWQ